MRQINSLEELNVPSNYQGFLHYFLTNISNVKSVSKVILFGSCARGQVKDRSDIDLFVLTKDEVAPDEEFYIMDDCPPAYDNEYYIPADIIVKNEAVFNSVIIVTDRRVLDQQLQATVSGFDHTLGNVATIDEKKNSGDLRNAINDGKRIIVTTLQKFPVIYNEVNSAVGKRYAIIVDEAYSSQTGQSALKL